MLRVISAKEADYFFLFCDFQNSRSFPDLLGMLPLGFIYISVLTHCPSGFPNSRRVCPVRGLSWLNHSKSKLLEKQFKRLKPGFVFVMNIRHRLVLVLWNSKGKLEIQDFGGSWEVCQKMSQRLFCQYLSQMWSRFIIWPTTDSNWEFIMFPKTSHQSISD